MARKFESDESFRARVLERTGRNLKDIRVVGTRVIEGESIPYFPDWQEAGMYPGLHNFRHESIEATRVRPDGWRETVFCSVDTSWSPDDVSDELGLDPDSREEAWRSWYAEVEASAMYCRTILPPAQQEV